MRIGSLFAGIGGLELGLERAGVGRTAWQVERDPYASAVLAKHWPEAKRHDDVTTFPPDDGTDWSADVICGGFPCQDISYAGKGAGIDGARSGLFFELMRIVRLVRPRFVVLENVAALLERGLDRVLGSLAEIGFDAQWSVLSSCALGAAHARRRLFIIANDREVFRASNACLGIDGSLAGAFSESRGPWIQQAEELSLRGSEIGREIRRRSILRESDVCGSIDGIPTKLDLSRIGALGNAVDPRVAEVVGRRLMEIASARGDRT